MCTGSIVFTSLLYSMLESPSVTRTGLEPVKLADPTGSQKGRVHFLGAFLKELAMCTGSIVFTSLLYSMLESPSVTRTGLEPIKLADPTGSQGLPIQTAFDRFCVEPISAVQNRFFQFFSNFFF
jgi:hypothetical protein